MTDPITGEEAFADLNPDVEILSSRDNTPQHHDAQYLERLHSLGFRVVLAEDTENQPGQRSEVVRERVAAAQRIAKQRDRSPTPQRWTGRSTSPHQGVER